MSILTKNLIPGNPAATLPGSPGSPGTPPHPAYCVTQAQTVEGTKILFLANDSPPPAYVEIPVSTGPQTELTTVCYPASSGTPPGAPGAPIVIPATLTNFEIGWNASAISIQSLAADGRYEVTPSTTAVGIVTGITPIPGGVSYTNITHGVYFATDTYQYIENGVPLTPATAFTAGDVFTVRRLGTGIAYFRNSTLDYTSQQPSTGSVWAQACMYFGGDQLLDASFDPSEPPASLDAIGSVGTFDPVPPPGVSPPPQVPGTQPQYTNVAGVMGPIVGYSGDQQGVGSNGIPPYQQGPPDSTGDWPGRSGGQLPQMVPSISGNPNVADVAGVLGGIVASIYSGGGAAGGASDYALVAGTLGSIEGSSGGGFLAPNYALVVGVIQGIQGFAIGQGGNLGSVAGVLAGPVPFIGDEQGVASNGPGPFVSGPPTTTTLFLDTFTGSGTFASGHTTPDIGGAYAVDGADPLSNYSLNGSGDLGSSTETQDAASALTSTPAGTYTLSETFSVASVGTANLALDLSAVSGVIGGAASYLVEGYLVYDGTSWTLEGYVSSASGSTIYDSGAIAVTVTTGASQTLVVEVTPAGVSWILNGTVIASTTIVPPIQPQYVAFENNKSTGTGSGALIDVISVVSITPGTESGAIDQTTGDWVGRSGGQLRNIVATIYDSTALLTGGIVIASHSGQYPFLAIGSWGSLVDSDGDPAPGYGIFGKHHGDYGFEASGYGVAEGSLPSGTFTASASQPNIGNAIGTLPVGTFIGSGQIANFGTMIGTLRGRYVVIASGYGVASGELPVGTFIGSGDMLNVGTMIGSYSRGDFVSSASWGNVGVAIGVLPVLVIVPSATMIGAMSGRGYFEALGDWDLAAIYEAYALTLHWQEPTQSAPPTILASHYTTYPFDRILRWQGHYYGVAKDGVYLLEGPQFGTTPIVAVIAGAESDLGTPMLKRARQLYVSGSLGQDATFSVTSDEVRTTNYAYRQAVRPGTATHRYKFGHGTRGTYLSYQFSNAAGMPFRIKTISPEIDVLTHTV